MNTEWKITVVYTAVSWALFLCSEIPGRSGWEMLAMLGYFTALIAGAIALLIRLVKNIIRRKSILAPLAMVLALLPFVFMLEIREGAARAEDFLMRNARQQIVEEVTAGSVDADEYGFAQLPAGRKHLSEDGEFRVLRRDGALEAVEFYNMRAILGAAFSTVYCMDGDVPEAWLLSADQVYECKPLGGGWYYVWYE